MDTKPTSPPNLLSDLREQLADVDRQLENPKLYQLARTQLEARGARLAWEIDELQRLSRHNPEVAL